MTPSTWFQQIQNHLSHRNEQGKTRTNEGHGLPSALSFLKLLFSPEESSTPPTTDNNGNSRLLSLPIELRLQIYAYVLSTEPLLLLYLTDRKRRLKQPELPPNLTTAPYIKVVRIQACNRNNNHPLVPLAPLAPHRSALLKTCHQIHAEALSLFYTITPFIVISPPILFTLSQSIPAQQFHAIRSLWLMWSVTLRWYEAYPIARYTYPDWNPERLKAGDERWLNFCELLAQMKGLRELVVQMDKKYQSRELGWQEEKAILEPLGRIRGEWLQNESAF